MPSGMAAGVCVLPHAAGLPVLPPPGLTVVLCPGAAVAEGTGAAIAGILRAGDCLTVDEACAVLALRRAEAVGGPAAHHQACAARAASAFAAVEKARVGLSAVPSGLTAAAVRSAAHSVAEGIEAVREARHAVGIRPGYDEASAAAARAAQAEVERARSDRADALPKANRALAVANGMAAVVVAGRLVSEAFDRAFLLVAVIPAGALAYAAHVVIGPVRRSREAARRRWAALRSMNVSTLNGLAVLQERAGAWERRAAHLTAAESELRAGREAWRSLVGDSVALASAERLANDLDAFAVVESTAGEAARAWAESAAALQAVEDAFPPGDPLVVLDADPDAGDHARSAATARLAALAGATTVVLVVAEPVPVRLADVEQEAGVAEAPGRPARWPAPALVPDPAPAPVPVRASAAGEPTGIVDLRERVKAGLLRLRSRSAHPRDPSAPGSVAAEG